jgi:hypothetical protein
MSVPYYIDLKELLLSGGYPREKAYEFHRNSEEPNDTFFSILSKFIYYAVDMNEDFKELAREQLCYEQNGFDWNWKTIHNELRRKMCLYWLNLSDSLTEHERYLNFSRDEFVQTIRHVASNDMNNVKERVYRYYLIEDVCNFLNIKMCACKSELKRNFGSTDSPFFDLIFTYKFGKLDTERQGPVTFIFYLRKNDHLKMIELNRERNIEFFDITNQVFGSLPMQTQLPSVQNSPEAIACMDTVGPDTIRHNSKFTAANLTKTDFDYVPYNPYENNERSNNNFPMVHRTTNRKDIISHTRVIKSSKK